MHEHKIVIYKNILLRNQKTAANSDDNKRKEWCTTQNRDGLPHGKFASRRVQKRMQ